MNRVVAQLAPLAFDADTQIRREAITVLSQHVEPGSIEFMHVLVSPARLHLARPPTRTGPPGPTRTLTPTQRP